jgi:hypothetical protein
MVLGRGHRYIAIEYKRGNKSSTQQGTEKDGLAANKKQEGIMMLTVRGECFYDVLDWLVQDRKAGDRSSPC